jgi:hypothetical protein
MSVGEGLATSVMRRMAGEVSECEIRDIVVRSILIEMVNRPTIGRAP